MALEPHTHELPDELGENIASENIIDHDRPVPRQHSPRNDPSMRDGNSAMGNVYESDPGRLDTDNDTGDADDEPVAAGFDGGASEGTPAELRADMSTDADDFTLGSREEPDADDILEEGPAENRSNDGLAGLHATAAAPDPLPHPQVNPGEDGSTIGKNEPPRPARLPTQSAPADEGTVAEVDLPIERYSDLTITEIMDRTESLSPDQLRQVRDFEAAHRNRKTLVTKLDRLLRGGRKRRTRETAEAQGSES
jgi:hypothetical protein